MVRGRVIAAAAACCLAVTIMAAQAPGRQGRGTAPAGAPQAPNPNAPPAPADPTCRRARGAVARCLERRDLPNITVAANGTGMMDVYTTRVTMGGPTGLFDADGSAIIIHANLDPGVGGPAGSGISGGPRIGCGVIER